MQYPQLTVNFLNIREAFMSSRFNEAELELIGDWIPKLPEFTWQDLCADSEDGRFLTLVAWSKIPWDEGFRLVNLDKQEREIRLSRHYSGFCNGIKWHSGWLDVDVRNITAEGIAQQWPLFITGNSG